MIRILRDRTAIPAGFIPGTPAGEQKELTLLTARQNHLVRLQANPKAGHDFDSGWWKSAKDQLIADSFEKCAYCEAKATAISYGDVEHFRPKADWWWLTCAWENYLFSCQRCNQQFKKDYFPFAGKMSAAPVAISHTTTASALAKMPGKLVPDPTNAAACTAHFGKLFKTEKPDLIDPANEDPEALLAYQADDDDFQVTVIPRTATAAVKRRVAACIQYYGLNREELCELRYDLYETLAEAREDLAEPGLPAARRTKILKRLERFVDKKRQFAGMARYYLIDTWKLLPASLRTP